MDLVEADLLLDETEFLSPLVDKMVDGAVDEGIVQEKMYGLPDSVRPQLLMYNKAIFDQYGIDPEIDVYKRQPCRPPRTRPRWRWGRPSADFPGWCR